LDNAGVDRAKLAGVSVASLRRGGVAIFEMFAVRRDLRGRRGVAIEEDVALSYVSTLLFSH
jgi:hypothetical protein